MLSQNRCNELIYQVIGKEVIENLDTTKIVSINSNNVSIDPVYLNTILVKSSIKINDYLNNGYTDKIKLPYSILFNEILFSHGNKSLEVMIRPIQTYALDIVSDISEYGINNSLLTINLIVKSSVEVLIPLNKEIVEVTTQIPLVIQIINGVVPNGILYKNDLS